MEIQELKNKIQQLINYASRLNERSKNLTKLLFQQLDEVKELETLERLTGKFLEAYLLWKSIKRANYQEKHLRTVPQNSQELLETINKEIELIEKNNQQEITSELTNEELWQQLTFRLKSGKFARADFISKGKELLAISKQNE